MLFTIGRVNYYLGPINTLKNPNINIDHLYVDYNMDNFKSKKTNII